MNRISKEQKTAAKSIMQNFITAFRWVILLAQMQSGKSDTYMLVAAEMLRQKKVKKVIILGGFQSNDLKSQVKNFEPFFQVYRTYMQEELNIGNKEERKEIEKLISTNIKVICGADLDKKKEILDAKDTLFIWDESHYAQNKTNRPYKFLEKVNISADGNHKNLEGVRNNFVISVSATPYSEISDVVHETQPKAIVKMMPGKGYVSVKKLYTSGKIIGVTNWEQSLAKCLQDQKKCRTPKYMFVRVHGDKKAKIAGDIAKSAGCKFEEYDGVQVALTKKNHDLTKIQSLDDLAKAPTCNTLIIIRGMLRMGQRICKNHIAFVMETSKNSNTDVILQGLLGRMCGYYVNNNIKVYVGENLLKKKGETMSEIERYISLMESETQEIKCIPQKATNLGSSSSEKANENGWFSALPIIIESPDSEDFVDCEKEKLISQIKKALEEGSAINHNEEEKTKEILQQIDHIELENCFQHKIAKSNGTINESYKEIPKITKELVSGCENKWGLSSVAGGGFNLNDKPQFKIWIYNTDEFRSEGFPNGTIVLQAQTKIASESQLKNQEAERNIPKTSKLEAFTTKQEDGKEVVGNGAYSIQAPVESSYDTKKMQEFIENMVKLSRMEFTGIVLPRYITSNQAEDSKWKGIIVNAEVLKSLEKNGSIYNYINETYNYKLKIARTPGKVPAHIREAEQIRLAKIEWV